MATDNEIKVDVKAFAQASEDISKMLTSLATSITAYIDAVNSLRSVWQGDTSNNVKGMGLSMLNSMEILMTNLGKYPKALNEVAGIYTTAEKQLSETGKSLNFEGMS